MFKILRHPIQASRYFSSAAKINLSGIYPPIVTPFSSNEHVDWNKLEENVSLWNKIAFRGYVIGGSNGESVNMTSDEKVEMVSKMRQMAGKDQLIIAGSGCESTRATLNLTELFAKANADAALVVTPSFYKGKMDNGTLIEYYTKVADASPIPVILYSVPANTSIDISPEVAIELAKHPNIIGMKDSGGDITKLGLIVHKTKHLDFQVLAGSAGHLFAAYMLGCVGGVCALANSLGQPVLDLHNLVWKGQLDEAKQLQYRLIAPNTAVTKTYGVAGLKTSMEWFGFYGGLPRSPLRPISSSEYQTLKNIFISEGFLS